MPTMYNAPPATTSSVGEQQYTHYYYRKAIMDARDEMFFTPLGSAIDMPKHYGKKVSAYFYVPLLDERNINDQGLDANGATITDGNLYGSSKDVGTITSRLPVLAENSERANRVGFTRETREAEITELGFFFEFTKDSLDFDSDQELMEHLTRESLNGAVQLNEAVLQLDLLAGAGTISFTGDATTDAEISGEGGSVTVVTYEDLARLRVALDENRTPKKTTIITGSTKIDTKTLQSSRFMYIAPALENTIRHMRNSQNESVFVPVEKYADAAKSTLMSGEIGAAAGFRFIVVNEMFSWDGAGATETVANAGYRATGGNYDVYPMLTIGDDSFVTVGYQSKGQSKKFDIITQKPGESRDSQDIYRKKGYQATSWWYGTLIKRPERIAIIKTVAPI